MIRTALVFSRPMRLCHDVSVESNSIDSSSNTSVEQTSTPHPHSPEMAPNSPSMSDGGSLKVYYVHTSGSHVSLVLVYPMSCAGFYNVTILYPVHVELSFSLQGGWSVVSATAILLSSSHFSKAAVRDSVDLLAVSDIPPNPPNTDLLLLSSDAIQALHSVFETHIARILVDHLLFIKPFADVVDWHIEHEFSLEMAQKSEVVSVLSSLCQHSHLCV